MTDVLRSFAGDMRLFRLSVGAVLDIEEGCGGTGIGAIYKKLSAYEFHLRDVKNCVLHPLIAGGVSAVEADRLVMERIDAGAAEVHALALDLLISFFDGVKGSDGDEGGDPEAPHDKGAIFKMFAKLGVMPNAVRDVQYSDYVAMIRSAVGDTVQPPTEEEFNEMVKAYEKMIEA